MLVVVFVLYPLGVGPAFVLLFYAGNTRALGTAYQLVYFPLLVACQATGSEQVLNAYIEWWAELALPPAT